MLESEEHGRLVVPFTLNGVSSGFSISSPDDDELDRLPIFEITSSSLHWDPNSDRVMPRPRLVARSGVILRLMIV